MYISKKIAKIKKGIFNKIANFYKLELFTNYRDDMFMVIKNLKDRGYNPEYILDVGAYKGSWTLEVSKSFRNANFIMFEAQEDKEKYLKEIAQSNPMVEYNLGLLGAETVENVPFYVMETGSSVLYENTEHKRSIKYLSMYTLDSILKNKNISSCFLKIDVQGYELEVLKGSKNLLPNVEVVLLETSIVQYNEGSPLISDVIKYMGEIDFVVYDICSPKRSSKEHVLFQVDIFFVKKNSHLRQIDDF